MIGYGVDESFDDPPQIAYRNYSIWRLMIDEKYQGHGYGKEAIRLALEFIRSFPCGKAEYCYLSYEPENVGAKRLYSKFGFIENGEMDGEEIVAVLKLWYSDNKEMSKIYKWEIWMISILTSNAYEYVKLEFR